MTYDKKNFVTFKTTNGKVYLAGQHNVVRSKGISTINFKVPDDKNLLRCVTMNDVVYVPSLRNNLLSVMKLIDHGLKKVSFVDHSVKITNKDSSEIIATGKRINNHFVIDMIPGSEVNNNYKCYKASLNSKSNNEKVQVKFNGDDANIWHCRLGHINNKYMQKLIKEELTRGINNNIKDVDCDACKTCKLTRKPHKTVLYDQSTQPLELLHMEVCGPMPVESMGNARYVLLIIDDYSGMYFTYFLKKKE